MCEPPADLLHCPPSEKHLHGKRIPQHMQMEPHRLAILVPKRQEPVVARLDPRFPQVDQGLVLGFSPQKK
jgi:hypothetical protein